MYKYQLIESKWMSLQFMVYYWVLGALITLEDSEMNIIVWTRSSDCWRAGNYAGEMLKSKK